MNYISISLRDDYTEDDEQATKKACAQPSPHVQIQRAVTATTLSLKTTPLLFFPRIEIIVSLLSPILNAKRVMKMKCTAHCTHMFFLIQIHLLQRMDTTALLYL